MSFGKTSKKEQSQEIDPMLRSEAIANTNLIRSLARMGFRPYKGNTIAGFNPAQQAAASMSDSFASAFGFGGAAREAVDAGVGTDDGSGISGFSPFEGMRDAMGSDYNRMKARLDKWFKQAGKKTKYQKEKTTGGGGKK